MESDKISNTAFSKTKPVIIPWGIIKKKNTPKKPNLIFLILPLLIYSKLDKNNTRSKIPLYFPNSATLNHPFNLTKLNNIIGA